MTSTALWKEANVSDRCQSVSRMAFDTSVPSVSFRPKRGKVEKKVSSTLPMSSLAFRFRLAASTTTGVNFSGVNIKWIARPMAADSRAISEPSTRLLIQSVFFTFIFISHEEYTRQK